MNSDLQNKLFHFEADPPGEVWNKIADVLDADVSFPQRLHQYEENPPTHVWESISHSLGQEAAPTRIIPFTTRYKKPLRYIAAASIIAIALAITTLNIKPTEAGSVIGGTKTVAPFTESAIIPSDRPRLIEEPTPSKTEPITRQQEDERKEVYARKSASKRSLSFIRPQNIFSALHVNNEFIPQRADKEEFFDFSSLDNFIVYSDGNGNAMKVPKKLYNLVHCEEGDHSCKERIHQLQLKMATSAITNDFTGLLEILRQLQ